jgi:hypothetical protein
MECLDDLIYYNVVFHYHNEPIELMNYYLNNLKFLLNNIIKHTKTQIQICINFFVSNIDNFIHSLKQHKYIHTTNNYTKYIHTTNNYTKYKHKIYENKTNYIETEYIDIKPINYDFEIRIHEIISKPLKNITEYNSNNIYKYDNGKFIFTPQILKFFYILVKTFQLYYKPNQMISFFLLFFCFLYNLLKTMSYI